MNSGPESGMPADPYRLLPRENERVMLRPWREDDLPVIREASLDPYIPLVTTVPVPYTPDEGHAWLRRQQYQAAERRGCPAAIVPSGAREPVGLATVSSIDWQHRRADIGYWILDRHRGHGYAKAAAALLPGLARDIGLVRIQALVEPANDASQAVCTAAGFTREGLLRSYYRIAGTNRDMIVFAMILRGASADLAGWRG